MVGLKSDNRTILAHIGVLFNPDEKRRFDAVCGPGRPMKRGAWVREAILAHLAVEETTDRAIAARAGGRKGAA